MTADERADLCRRIASLGGRAVVEKHGRAYMSELGRKGFAAAIALGWGPELARKLAPSYREKFGCEPVLGPQSREKARIRREARALYGGNPCDVPGCGEPAEVHHTAGVVAGNDPSRIELLCKAHHVEHHRRLRNARRAATRSFTHVQPA